MKKNQQCGRKIAFLSEEKENIRYDVLIVDLGSTAQAINND